MAYTSAPFSERWKPFLSTRMEALLPNPSITSARPKHFRVGSHLHTVCTQDSRAQRPESNFQLCHLPTTGPVASFPSILIPSFTGVTWVKCDNVLKQLAQCLPLKKTRINGSCYHYYSYYDDHHSSEE